LALARNLDYEGLGRIKAYPVAPSSTFVAGDFLTFDSSGRLQQTVSTGANYGASALIVGRALENALKDDGSLKAHVSVIIAEPGTRFKMPIYHGTPASAVFNSNLLLSAASDYELRNTSGGFPALDISATTNKKVRIVDGESESYPGWPDTVGAGTQQFPNVWVEFMGSACALFGGR
jgi:hypothetical protein